MMLVSRKRVFALLLVVFLAGCGDDSSDLVNITDPPPPPGPQRGDLVSVTHVTSENRFYYLLLLATGIVPGVDGADARYGVNAYKVIYKTEDPLGNIINASGVLAIPAKSPGSLSPIISFQNGTIMLDDDAPTNTATTNLNGYKASIFPASLGYIFVIPDYIGFGESASQMHTYVHAGGLANATIDMLRATRTYLNSASIGWNNQLFITGYSEGGYATMAAHKAIETDIDVMDEFQVTAAVHGGGPYDLSGTVETMLNGPALVSPAYVGFIFKTYDTYEIMKTGPSRTSEIFQAPYVSVIDTYYDGTHSSGQTDAALTTVTADLFTGTFLTAYQGDGETELKALFAANDVYNWIPSAPTRLFHGLHDTVVPYANATTAYDFMIAGGAIDVGLQTCTLFSPLIDDAHILCVPEYMGYMMSEFNARALNL